MENNSNTKGYRRYPGVYSFSSEQKDIFFGRDSDIEKLRTLVEVEKQILLYSKSGIGKTSLLNAGVIPLLPKDYIIIKIRFFNYNKTLSPVERIIATLQNDFPQVFSDKNTILDQLVNSADANKTLWFYIKKMHLSNIDKTFVFIFDQFEELFSFPAIEIADFKNQVYDLINNRMPEAYSVLIENKIDADSDFIAGETFKILHKSPDIKNIYAMRSDRLSELNSLTDKISDIQKVFYELQPLTTEQTKQAIINPAEKKGHFESNSFTYQPDAIDKIISELTDQGKQNIECTQLQIVCQQIEDISSQIIQRRHTLSQIEEITIQIKDLPKFDSIFYNFYEQSIKKLGATKQENARLLIEDQLIRNNMRISLDENICTDYLIKQDLDILVSAHLIRAELNSIGRLSYELSHDTLIAPISEARKQRIEKQEEEKAKRENEENLRIANEKALNERYERLKEKKRQRNVIIIVFTSAIVSLVFAIWGFFMLNNANEQKNIANKALGMIRSTVERDANFYLQSGEFEKAKNKFIYLRDTVLNGKTDRSLDIKIRDCTNLIEKKASYDTLMMQAKIAIDKMQYEQSVNLYIQASKIPIANNQAISSLKDLKRDLERISSALSNDIKNTDDQDEIVSWQKKLNMHKELLLKIDQTIKQ